VGTTRELGSEERDQVRFHSISFPSEWGLWLLKAASSIASRCGLRQGLIFNLPIPPIPPQKIAETLTR
jgi:hypothetical protein